MKNLSSLLLLFVFMLGLSSCFEVTEEVTMNNDGSGNLTVTINMSESKDNLQKFMQQGEVEGFKIPQRSDIEQYLAEAKSILMKQKGISQVQLNKNYEDFIFTLSGNFANAAALNNAVNGLAEQMNKSDFPTIKRDNYSYANGSFIRHFDYPIEVEQYRSLSSMHRFVLETARMVAIYRFDRAIKKVSNSHARISPSKKSVMMMTSLGSIAKGEKTLANKIEF